MPNDWGELEEDDVLRVLYSQTVVEEGLNVLEKRDINMVEVFSTALKPVEIQPDELTVEEALCIAKRLKSVHVNETGDDSSQSVNRKKSPELPDLLGISDIRHIDLAKLWAYRVGKERLRVPIGLFDDTSTAFLDIKEMGQHGMGPHGVLVGATGSGKSEVLRTLVLSLALSHSPDQLNFVLIDFKGGATFAGMDGMPHISSIITNLGKEASLVDVWKTRWMAKSTDVRSCCEMRATLPTSPNMRRCVSTAGVAILNRCRHYWSWSTNSPNC